MASVNLVNATSLDMCVYAGDTMPAVIITFTDSITNDPIDLTGVNFKMEIKKTISPNAAAMETLSLIGAVSDGITLSGGAHNILTLKKIINLLGGTYFYDLQGTWPNTDIITYLKGEFEVIQDVTDNTNEV